MCGLMKNVATALLVGGLLLGIPAEACRGQVLINEVLADPAHDWDGDGTYQFRNDEWVEVVNAGSQVLSLDGLYLSDATDDFHFGFAGSLEPGGIRLVYGSDSVAWESANGASTVGLSLNNAGVSGGSGIPVLILQGTGDTVVTPDSQEAFRNRLCEQGTAVTYLEYPAVPHTEIRWTSFGDALSWMQRVVNGDVPETDCDATRLLR
jgi:acetyl esterase/lipase